MTSKTLVVNLPADGATISTTEFDAQIACPDGVTITLNSRGASLAEFRTLLADAFGLARDRKVVLEQHVATTETTETAPPPAEAPKAETKAAETTIPATKAEENKSDETKAETTVATQPESATPIATEAPKAEEKVVVETKPEPQTTVATTTATETKPAEKPVLRLDRPLAAATTQKGGDDDMLSLVSPEAAARKASAEASPRPLPLRPAPRHGNAPPHIARTAHPAGATKKAEAPRKIEIPELFAPGGMIARDLIGDAIDIALPTTPDGEVRRLLNIAGPSNWEGYAALRDSVDAEKETLVRIDAYFGLKVFGDAIAAFARGEGDKTPDGKRVFPRADPDSDCVLRAYASTQSDDVRTAVEFILDRGGEAFGGQSRTNAKCIERVESAAFKAALEGTLAGLEATREVDFKRSVLIDKINSHPTNVGWTPSPRRVRGWPSLETLGKLLASLIGIAPTGNGKPAATSDTPATRGSDAPKSPKTAAPPPRSGGNGRPSPKDSRKGNARREVDHDAPARVHGKPCNNAERAAVRHIENSLGIVTEEPATEAYHTVLMRFVKENLTAVDSEVPGLIARAELTFRKEVVLSDLREKVEEVAKFFGIKPEPKTTEAKPAPQPTEEELAAAKRRAEKKSAKLARREEARRANSPEVAADTKSPDDVPAPKAEETETKVEDFLVPNEPAATRKSADEAKVEPKATAKKPTTKAKAPTAKPSEPEPTPPSKKSAKKDAKKNAAAKKGSDAQKPPKKTPKATKAMEGNSDESEAAAQ